MSQRLAALLALVILPGHALAWNQATSEDGVALHWDTECVYWTLAGTGSDDIEDFETLAQAVRNGFEAWNVDCSALQVLDGGVSDCTAIGYTPGRPHANLVIWLEQDWPYETTVGDPYAVTSVYYNSETGAILDADVEFNGEDFPWGTEGHPEEADVWNTVAHEAGHVLGLDHTGVTNATMYLYSERGDTHKRDLHEDDIEGICAIYPLGSVLEPCPGPPRGKALCQGDSSGCSCAVPGARGSSGARHAWLLALVIVMLAVTRGRERVMSRRPRRRPTEPR